MASRLIRVGTTKMDKSHKTKIKINLRSGMKTLDNDQYIILFNQLEIETALQMVKINKTVGLKGFIRRC